MNAEQITIFTVGLEGVLSSFIINAESKELERSFNAQDHIGKIRSLTVSPQGFLCSGGEDDAIKFYNSSKRHYITTLLGYNSTVKKMLCTKKYLICGQENGKVSIIGFKDFSIYHSLNVFRNKMIDMDIHSSGRLLVCLSATGRFAVWSLLDCSMIFHRKVAYSPEGIRFINEDMLIIYFKQTMVFFSIKEMKAVHELQTDSNDIINDLVVHSIDQKKYILVGCESGFVRIYFFDEEVTLQHGFSFRAYEQRVKSVRALESNIFTISTEGFVSVWDCKDIFSIDFDGFSVIKNFLPISELRFSSRLVMLEVCKIEYKKEKLETKAFPEETVQTKKKTLATQKIKKVLKNKLSN